MITCDCACAKPGENVKIDAEELMSPIYHACGGKVYWLVPYTKPEAVLMSDGNNLATRLVTLEKLLRTLHQIYFVDTIAARDTLTSMNLGDICYVKDTTGDESVKGGEGATYLWTPERVWRKIYDGLGPWDAGNLLDQELNINLKENGGLFWDEGKLAVSLKENGGLTTGEHGKLACDFTLLDTEGLKKLLSSLISETGGLSVNEGDGKLELNLDENGGLKTGEDGKLSVDFSQMPGSDLKTLLEAIIDSGGGLKAGEDGKLSVDFSQMPTEKFEALLKSIGVPIPLEAPKDFYVDKETGADTLDEGRGETEEKPFKTIQACVDYVTKYYNMGPHRVVIKIAAGTYEENLSLPSFARTTSRIVLQPKGYDSGECNVTVKAEKGKVVGVSGGDWGLYGLDLVMESRAGDVARSDFGVDVYYGGRVTLFDYSVSTKFLGEAPGSGKGVALYTLRCCAKSTMVVAGGQYRQNKLIFDKGNASVCYPVMIDQGEFYHFGSNIKEEYAQVACEGACTVFIYVLGGYYGPSGGNTYRGKFVPATSKTVTGRRYIVNTGGRCNVSSQGADFFPGSIAGTCDETTFSYYK